MKYSFEGPWGKAEFDDKDIMGVIRHCRSQLKYFLKNGSSPNPAFTKQEIKGYEKVIVSGREENAKAFIDLKAEYRYRGEVPPSNFEIIALLKQRGTWKE